MKKLIVISTLKPNKSPGPDGFPSEWYKSLRGMLLPILVKSFKYTFKEGFLPPFWREASISVIPKEGKDLTESGSYRPISVLNQVYKFFTTILAKWMEEMMTLLIDEHQTGFVWGRQTRDNLRRSLNRIHNLKALPLSMDAEKAFDSVGWECLYKVMERFGFHQNFIQSIKTLYTGSTAQIKVNGSLSNPIYLWRGCNQDCPVSPCLFNLFIEPLAQAISHDMFSQ